MSILSKHTLRAKGTEVPLWILMAFGRPEGAWLHLHCG